MTAALVCGCATDPTPAQPIDESPQVAELVDAQAGTALASAVAFDATEVGQSTNRSVVVVNRGRATTGTVFVAVSGAAAGDFTVAPSSTCPGIALERDATCQLDLVFHPASDGNRSATVVVGARPGGQLTFGLSGVATPVPLPPADEVSIAIAGGGAGEVEAFDLTTFETLAICTSDCRFPVRPGQQVQIAAAAISSYGGLSGACSAAEGRCSFTAVAGTNTVTASFIAEVKERWTATPGGSSIGTAAFDSAGNLVVGKGSAGVSKLAPDGSIVWTVPLRVCTLATGPGDTIYAQTSTQVVKLGPDGATLWAQPLDPRAVGCGLTFDGFVHNLAVGRDGAVAIQGDSGVARWDADGNLSWSAPLANQEQYGVAIDAAGNVNAGISDLLGGDGIGLARFAPDGTPLESVERLTSQYHGMFLYDAADQLIATASGHSHTDLSSTAVRDTIRLPDPDYAANGVCSSGNGDIGWLYVTDDNASFFARDWVVNRYRNGQKVWTLSRRYQRDFLNGDLGTIPYDIAEDANGNIAVVGQFNGPVSSTSFVQIFAP